MPNPKSQTKNQAKIRSKVQSVVKGKNQHTPRVPPSAEQQLPNKPGEATVASRNGRVQAYQNLVRPIAAFYASRTPEPFDDLLQVGLMGLMRAAELYCRTNRTPFEAFAKPHVRGAILHYLRDAAPMIRLPRRIAELQQRAKKEGESGSSQQDLTSSQRRALEELKTWGPPISLDQLPLDGLNLAAPPPANQGAHGEEPIQAVKALQHLDSQSQWIVGKVVLEGWSYRRTASQLQVSPMTVQRKLKQGLARVRSALEQQQAELGASWHPCPSAAGGY
jgi:RNA polymerase sigma-B factor